MDHRLRAAGVPAVRLDSRLHLATFFPSSSPSLSSRRGARHGSAGPPPALTADVRVVIRRHFPVVGPCGTRIVAKKVAEDIVLRRRPSRKLRGTEDVERALAEEVLPRVAHPFDRGAVVASRKEICARVAAACADARIAHGGAHVLVLIDTFARPVVLRLPPPCKTTTQGVVRAPKSFAVRPAGTCIDMDSKSSPPAKKSKPIGVIGDGRPKPTEERSKGWVPW
ncbi:hypothetical protein ACP70R_016602 [Stipagrostis hirtigluma subsp. patula]